MPSPPALLQPQLLPAERLEHRSVPLQHEDPWLKEHYADQIMDGVLPLLSKVAPHLNDGAAERFRVAITAALSDLPGDVAVEAVRRSLSAQLKLEPRRKCDGPSYRPIQRPGEIETLIRQQADNVRRERLSRNWPGPDPASSRQRQPKIEPPSTQAEVDELNLNMRKFGIKREFRLNADSRIEAILTDAELRQRAKYSRYP
jgi:hypothetical protein